MSINTVDSGSVGDVLEYAADLIESCGWLQGTLWNNEGFCMVGAIMNAPTRIISLQCEAADYLINYMRVHGYNARSIPDWNDNPWRTKFEVLEVLRQSAKEWRNEHF